MPAAAACLLLFLFAPARAKTDEATRTLRIASEDVHDALLNNYILMSSAQATLVEMQWHLNRWKLTAQKNVAARQCGQISEKLKRFRDEAEVVDAQTNPLAPFIDELMKS